MRYNEVPDEVFVNSKGETKILHGSRLPIRYKQFVVTTKETERELDDFAVKMWGKNSEIVSFVLREQNVEKLLEDDFDESKLIDVEVPPR